MSSSKKYKYETATEIQQTDTENFNNRFRKNADYFSTGPSTSAAATKGRTALGQQNTNNKNNNNTMQRSSSNSSITTNNTSNSNNQFTQSGGGAGNGSDANGERRSNFSMLEASNVNEHRSSITTSSHFNKMGTQNATKPGDVKKIVIKNFKGN